MSLNIDQKKAIVSEVAQTFSAAQVAVLAEYRGLTVAQITELRSQARDQGVDVRVVKNTLAKRSVAGSDFECLTDHFIGPVVISSSGDPVAVAKVISKFAKTNEALKITVGAMNGDLLDAGAIQALAKLPSRDELLAILVGTMNAPIIKLVRTLNEVPSKFVRVLAAVRDSRSDEQVA
ncbi:MAG: 50S ribosomal protein L10 [Arenicellales bacterium]|jgi:large subunit ribosomal protein L10|nr:50S ribosomal protein L10 [Arenicellales bacterium]MDP6314174.1 50S ribosomal protein L10 [Arenicellales bacterium]MDP7193210.1 50S ribosomal protein L10 [Arenicellales bacterium]MDP7489649.1 50S ribosomal protein L10 [Arenicellales bacterium]MEE1559124.1 50S ribosomal protein L10 [Arenicellales bacterium]|tara:strand:- start:464 stop:997 length:534 start_codon:yes stop_codon:yes gene_type:complete